MPKTTPILLDGTGAACAVLTPLIHRQMRQLTSGDLLEVECDDPAAREGVPAWTRLTGHLLVQTDVLDDRHTRFLIRKK